MTTDTLTIDRGAHTWVRWVLVAAPLAILAFLASPSGPLGRFWAPAPAIQAQIANATGAQVAGFILLNVAEAVTFGLGVAFLLFGYRASETISPTLSRAAHLSIAWLLLSWWPHGSLHMHYELASPGVLLALEYGFHVTLMVAGGILAYFFAKVMAKR